MDAKDFNGIGTFANIMLDSAFKVSFGKEMGRQNMIDLLNCLLPDKHITDISYEDKEQNDFAVSEKKSIFDLYCKTDDGDIFVVEMQLRPQTTYAERALFYSTFPLRAQLITPADESRMRKEKIKKEIKNYALKPVYVVSILAFGLDHAEGDEALRDGLVSSYSVRNDRNGEMLTDALHFIFFEVGRLPYGIHEWDRCEGILEQVAFSFKWGSQLTAKPESFENDFLNNLYHTMEIAKYDLQRFEEYYGEYFRELDRKCELEYAVKEGETRGEARGEKRGIEIGRADGRKDAFVELALKMLECGESAEKISLYTGLTSEEIAALCP